MMKCGPSHTTTCTCSFQVDNPWGRDLMFTKMHNQYSDSTVNQPSSQSTWSQLSNKTLAEDSHQPVVYLVDAGNEPDMSTDTDDLPDINMDRPLRVTFGKEL